MCTLPQAYQNERSAPEVLVYEDILVDRIQSRIKDRVRVRALGVDTSRV